MTDERPPLPSDTGRAERPPGAVPPGAVQSGAVPPEVVQSGAVPPEVVQSGAVPPEVVQSGAAPPAEVPSAEVPSSAHASDAPSPDRELRRPRRVPGPPADGLAVAALVVAIAGLSLVAVVLGHLALDRIVRRGSGGRGLAVAALVLGYAGLALFLVGWTVYFAFLAPLVTLPG